MRISLKWLRDYIDVKQSMDELAATLTRLGLEVESVEDLAAPFKGFVTAEVLSVEKHLKADRLSVCSVRAAQDAEPLRIVCGAPNVAAGQKVILGTIGAVVPHNQHDPSGQPFTLTKAVIRGVESSGMLCSGSELGLNSDHNGIMVLPSETPVGLPLSAYLGLDDIAMEIGITPNRPDCLSHIGIARDIAAVTGEPLKLSVPVLKEDNVVNASSLATVKIENTDGCPRYTARMIRNVTVAPSPHWMKQRLTAAGIRPINNIVDITNYVMLEYGQPMHAFDHDRIAGKTIIVKNAAKGEKFTTLDGKVHELTGSELMICDGERSVALAGVMGGENSEIAATTKNVLLESAYFSPVSVRKTAKRLGISTDASYRFERGIDPNIAERASARAAQLMAELAGGSIAGGVIDVYPTAIVPKQITLRPARVNAMLGTDLPSDKVIALLNALGINTVPAGEGHFTASVPTHRPDIEQEIDLVEEVARLYGYDNIENKLSSEVIFSKPQKEEQQTALIRRWLESNGLNEVVTNSLIDSPTAQRYSNDLITVRNPLSADLEVLRPSLLASMLQAYRHNVHHGADHARYFEVGTVFRTAGKNDIGVAVPGFSERTMLGILLAGVARQSAWYEKERQFDLFDLKGIVTTLLSAVGLDNSDLIYYNAPSSLTESTIGVEINGTYVGSIGKVAKEILTGVKSTSDVFYAELDLGLITRFDVVKKYHEFSKFPTVKRDVAFIVRDDIRVAEIMNGIRSAGGALVTSVQLFDLFEGKSIGEGKKSVAFSLSINSPEKTLTDTEIEHLISGVVRHITTTFDATLRSL